MIPATQSIVFRDGRKTIRHIEPGMVEPILNMTYMQQLMISEDCMAFRTKGKTDGEFDVIMLREDGEYHVASVVNDSDTIETIKEVKTLGNSVAISLSMECKMLGIVPGDRIRVRIEKVDG